MGTVSAAVSAGEIAVGALILLFSVLSIAVTAVGIKAGLRSRR